MGDIVCVGEVPLAVGRIGWTPVHGGLTEVRTSEHGTRPLTASRRFPETPDRTTTSYTDQGAT